MELIILLILVVIGFTTYFSFSKRLKSFRKKYSKGVDFYLTLFATIIGVFMALYISTIIEENKNKAYVIDMLKISKSDVKSSFQQNEEILKDIYSMATKDSIISNQDSLNIAINPLYYPKHFEKNMDKDIVARHIELFSYQSMQNDLDFSKKIKRFFEAYAYKNGLGTVHHYIAILKGLERKLDAEIQYQHHEISIEKKVKIFKKIDEQIAAEIPGFYKMNKIKK